MLRTFLSLFIALSCLYLSSARTPHSKRLHFRFPVKSSSVVAGGVLYVDETATGANNGASWSDAYVTLNAALSAANADTAVRTILVAKGTYYPTGSASGTDRNASFTLIRGGLKIVGGYNASTGTRDLSANPTYLSGDIGTAGYAGDNSYHVVVVTPIATGDSLILDGFTIAKGNSNGIGSAPYNGLNVLQSSGAAVAAFNVSLGQKFVLRNLTVAENTGTHTGLHLYYSNALISNCLLTGNSAESVLDEASSPAFKFCTFSFNGKGLLSYSSRPIVSYCRFGRNGAALDVNYRSVLVVSNSLFVHNTSAMTVSTGSYGKLYNCTVYAVHGSSLQADRSSTVEIYNSLVPRVLSYDYTVENTLVFFPQWSKNLFVRPDNNSTDPWAGDYHLKPCSALPNRASNAAILANETTDLEGNPRIRESIVDHGAYESLGAAQPNPATMTMASGKKTANGFQAGLASTSYYGTGCDGLIATLSNMKIYLTEEPFLTDVTATVWTDSITTNNYVRRHYEITPAIATQSVPAGTTYSGSVTLYFTQEDFDLFNAGSPPRHLPTDPTDQEGKNNVFILGKNGTSSDGSGSPQSYKASRSIVKADLVAWANNRWAVTFRTDQFGGFFITTLDKILPVELASFTARRSNQITLLQWKTATEKNVSHFDVQRSVDAVEFQTLQSVPARNKDSQTYETRDLVPFSGVRYYRLKMVDLDGTIAFSRTLSLFDQGNASMTDASIKLGPVPARSNVTLFITKRELIGQNVALIDSRGINLEQIRISQMEQHHPVGHLKPGIYFLRLTSGEAIRFIKE